MFITEIGETSWIMYQGQETQQSHDAISLQKRMLLLVSQSMFTVAENLILKYRGTQGQCVRGAEGPQGSLEMQKEASCQDWS